MMKKKVVLGTLCLLMAACSTEKNCYRENCFVTETQLTEDMQKIRSILIEYYRTIAQRELEYDLKFAQVTCKLFGKNNKQLNKEIDKLKKIYEGEKKIKESKKLRDDLKKSLKGLKLEYGQMVLLAKELEVDYAKIEKEKTATLFPYKSQAFKIVKAIDDQEQKQDDWIFAHYEDGLQWSTKFGIYHQMKEILNDNYNKFYSYNTLINTLEGFLSEGILVDSFLNKHLSSISPKDESSFEPYYFMYGFVPETAQNGEIIFDAVRKAVSNKKITKQELSDLLGRTSYFMESIARNIARIQNDITDKIDHDSRVDSYKERKWSNFYNINRYLITNLVDKNPHQKDFNQEIDKLSTRIAYKTYYKVNISRFLYKEWRDIYYSQVKELFVNAVKIADKLYEMIKNEVVTDDTSSKRRHEYQNNMQNISNVKEFAKIGVDKIISVADCYIDSQNEIKDSFRESFMKTREAYLKNLEQ